MTKQSAPLVTVIGLSDPELPAVLAIPQSQSEMYNSGWHDWLQCHSKFRFQVSSSLTTDASFTAYKSNKGFWSAQRRMHGRLRHQYLGESHTLTWDKLESTARKMAMQSESAYEKSLRKVDKELLSQSHKDESGREYETQRALSSQAGEEVAKLKAENEELKRQLNQSRQQLGKLEGAMKAAEELVKRQKTHPPADFIRQYETDYETIKKSLPKPPAEVTRNWVEFWRFKTWLESR